jgi:hypothetical protein
MEIWDLHEKLKVERKENQKTNESETKEIQMKKKKS